MALPSRIDGDGAGVREAGRELLLWTTRDGREIPLDEMSDEHVANAVRVLSLWRSRLKKRGGGDDAILADLKAAIERFKLLQRRRRKSNTAGMDDGAAPKSRPALSKPLRAAKAPTSGRQSPAAPSRWSRPRKPVAKT